MRIFLISLFGAFLLAVCIGDTIVINGTFSKLNTQVTEIKQEIDTNGASEKAKGLIAEIEKFWEKRQKLMSIFVHHEETKILGDKINMLKTYLKEDDDDFSKSEVSSLLYEIKTLRKQYAFNFANIF